jgi:hypothetical protein
MAWSIRESGTQNISRSGDLEFTELDNPGYVLVAPPDLFRMAMLQHQGAPIRGQVAGGRLVAHLGRPEWSVNVGVS